MFANKNTSAMFTLFFLRNFKTDEKREKERKNERRKKERKKKEKERKKLIIIAFKKWT